MSRGINIRHFMSVAALVTPLTFAVSLMLLVAGCATDPPTDRAPGHTGAGDATAGTSGQGDGGSGGSGGIGQATGGTAGKDPGIVACESRVPTLSFLLTPTVSPLSGTVIHKVMGTDGTEDVAIVDAVGAEYHLTLSVPLSAPIVTGERVDIRTAERRVFAIYRTLEVRKNGDVILYATDVEQPELPPPLRLEVGDQACAAGIAGIFSHRRLRAYDGDQAISIDVGQQADVGHFRVHNDHIRLLPGPDQGVVVQDAIDTFRVALVRFQ